MLVAPIINLEEVVERNQTNIEQLIYTISKEENFDNPKLLIALAFCESSLRPTIVVKNDNGSPSYGLLQWKYKSFWYFNEKYNIFPDLEYTEVENIIMNPEAQIRLAIKVLTQEKNGWQHWSNCAKKIGIK